VNKKKEHHHTDWCASHLYV